MKNIINKHGLYLEEYTSNRNNALVYYKRTWLNPLKFSKSLSKILVKILKVNDKILDVECATGHFTDQSKN